MDELEEFLTVFFQECEERVAELQENLAAIMEGEWDMETLNAAFRAVHSVKGGAGAFGLDELVEFTHVFETLMDALRSERIQPTDRVCQVLLRASDMMSSLIEKAQGNGDADPKIRDAIVVELAELAGVDAPESAKTNAAEAAPAVAVVEVDAPAPETASAAPAEPASPDNTAGETAAADDASAETEAASAASATTGDAYAITFAPGPDFVRSGHDPLKFIRALKKFGAVAVSCSADYPALEDHDPLETPLVWRLRLVSETPLGEIESFLFIYTMTAEIEITEDKSGGADAEPAADAPTETVDGPADAPPAPSPAPAGDPAAEPLAEPAAQADGSGESAPEPAVEQPPAAADSEGEAKSAESGARSAKPAAAQQQKISKALRVELSRIDRLVNMVGEIVITQAVLSQNLSELEDVADLDIGHAVEALSRQTRELQESVMAIRAQPVKSVFSRMPRVVRDLCASLDKDVRIVLSGEHTEVDTTVIEELSEPLTHMLRNSMDHGIESPEKREAAGKPRQGTIHLGAEHRGERVRIVISDDGAGINREKVLEKAIKNGVVSPDASLPDEEIDMLIFHPGFSTAEQVTNVSGRGVGMDVVKRKVQALGGRVSVRNTPGEGCEFAITLPLTLAVLEGMTIGVGEERFILPLGSVVEAVKVDQSNIDHLPGEVRVLRYRGEWLPLISLHEALTLETAQGRGDLVVVVETESDGRIAILVDELLGQRQVVLKSLEANFRRVEGVSGATILGDGRVALILDIPSLHAGAGGGGYSSMSQEFGR